jgi:hypothetical protein
VNDCKFAERMTSRIIAMGIDSIEHFNPLEKKRYFNYDLMCTEFTVYSAANRFDQSDPFLFAQSFANRIHAWWPTSAGFEVFLTSVNNFFRYQIDLMRELQTEATSDLKTNQSPWHVCFYLPNYQIEHLFIKDAESIHADMLNPCMASHDAIRMCRIGLPGSHLYYDLEPHDNGIRRAGIITNTTHEDLIFDYMSRTHADTCQEDVVRDIIREILAYTTFF